MKKIMKIGWVLLASGTLTGCFNISHKELSEAAPAKAQSQTYSQPGAVFVEIPYGAPVGTVMVPNFVAAVPQALDAFGMTLSQANSTRNALGPIKQNVPDVGFAASMRGEAIFSYSILAINICADKLTLDRTGSAASIAARPSFVGFNFGLAHSAPANIAARDTLILNLAKKLWARTDVTADEMSALTTLWNEVGADAVLRNGNTANAGLVPALTMVCAAMEMAPDSLVQ